jgi:hypothetical protein
MSQGGLFFARVYAPTVFFTAGFPAIGTQPTLMPMTAFAVFNESATLTMCAIHPLIITQKPEGVNTY